MSALPQQEFVGVLVEQAQRAVVVGQSSPAGQMGLLVAPSDTKVLHFSLSGGRDGPAGPAGPAGATGATGATGAPGVDATVHARRYEEAGNYIYCGTAPAGSAEDAAVWRITRLTYASGTLATVSTAVDVTWVGRSGHSYS